MAKLKNVNGIGPGTILFFIFLVLKLTNYIDWSWWWITAPLWAPMAILVLGFGLFVLYKSIVRLK